MTTSYRQNNVARAGRLACLCGPYDEELDGAPRTSSLTLLSAGFACAVLAQALALGMLPLAGAIYAPRPILATIPFAAFFVGAACASLPASLLLDAFGRRAGFALGASLGGAGGLLLAWSMSHGQFTAFVLGAFWLGIANGFGLFYRHSAAGLGASSQRKSLATLLGAGALVGVVAPSFAGWAESLSPLIFVGTAIAAAAAHIGALALALGLPARRPRSIELPSTPYPIRSITLPTIFGAIAWFAMTALMGASPIAMAGCGVASSTIAGAVAWHVIAMYAPALFIAVLPESIASKTILGAGLALLCLATGLYAVGSTAFLFTIALICLGAGWSFATIATTLMLHQPGPPPRWILGLHDAALFCGAICGAFMAGMIAL